MNQQVAYQNRLKQTMELYQFMAKLCWLKAITDKLAGEHGCSTAGCTGVVREESDNKTVDPQAQVGEKRTSGSSEKLATNLHLRKTTCKLLSHLEKPEVSTIVASAVIKGRMYDFNQVGSCLLIRLFKEPHRRRLILIHIFRIIRSLGLIRLGIK